MYGSLIWIYDFMEGYEAKADDRQCMYSYQNKPFDNRNVWKSNNIIFQPIIMQVLQAECSGHY